MSAVKNDAIEFDEALQVIDNYHRDYACANACDDYSQHKKEMSALNAKWHSKDPHVDFYKLCTRLIDSYGPSTEKWIDEQIAIFNRDVASKMGMFGYTVLTPSEQAAHNLKMQELAEKQRIERINSSVVIVERQLVDHITRVKRTLDNLTDDASKTKAYMIKIVQMWLDTTKKGYTEFDTLLNFVKAVDYIKAGDLDAAKECKLYGFSTDQQYLDKILELSDKYYIAASELIALAQSF
jgi:hypothetical protein